MISRGSEWRRWAPHTKLGISDWGFDTALLLLPLGLSTCLLALEPGMMPDLLKYAVFYLAIVLPAGIVFSRYLLADLSLTLFEQAILGYPAAVACAAVAFYITDSLNVRWVLYPVALFPAVWLMFRGKPVVHVVTRDATAFWVGIFYLLAGCLFFFAFTLTTRSPTPEQPGLYYQDALWTVGNTWAIIREGFPVTDARFDGVPFAYHMIQNIHLAFTHMMTGIDPFILHLRIAPLFDLFFLTGITAVGTNVFLGEKTWLPALSTFTLLFTAGAMSWLVTGYIGHLYVNPLSMFFGLPAFILVLLLVGHHVLTNRVFILYTAMLVLLALSSKASLAFSLFPSFLLYAGWRWSQGYRFGSRDILLAGALLLVVAALKFSLYDGAEGGFSAKAFTALTSAQIGKLSAWLGEPIATALAPLGPVLKLVWDFSHILASIILTLYAGFFLIGWVLRREFRLATARLNGFFIFIVGFSVFSALWISFFEFPGGEVYFVWYAVVAWIIPFVYVLRYLIEARPLMVYRAVALGLVACGVTLFGMYSSRFFSSLWWQGSVAGNPAWDERATISQGEWEAMRWVLGALPKDAVLISDRRGFNHESSGEFLGRFFGYSALSGRQFYNEGDNFNRHAVSTVAEDRWQLVNALINSDVEDEANRLWAKIPATHVIISKRFTEPHQGLDKTAAPVFENADIVILARPAAIPRADHPQGS